MSEYFEVVNHDAFREGGAPAEPRSWYAHRFGGLLALPVLPQMSVRLLAARGKTAITHQREEEAQPYLEAKPHRPPDFETTSCKDAESR